MNTFAKQLKKLRRDAGLSQLALAKAVGVGQSTIANYEKGLRSPHPDLLMALANTLSTSVDDLLFDQAHLRETVWQVSEFDLDKAIDDLLHLYLKGQHREAGSLIKAYVSEGMPFLYLYQKLITGLLHQVGLLWEKGMLSISTEHYISHHISQLIGYFTQSQPHPHANKALCVCLSIAGEAHDLGIKMLNHLLALEGWQTHLLGSNLPNEHVIDTLVTMQAETLALSCTLEENLPQLIDLIHHIQDHPLLKKTHLVIGGHALKKVPFGLKMTSKVNISRDFAQTLSKLSEIAHNL